MAPSDMVQNKMALAGAETGFRLGFVALPSFQRPKPWVITGVVYSHC